MTSCRNLFHSFPLPFTALSSLARLYPLFLSACHQTCINTFYFFHSLLPSLCFLTVLLLCDIKTEMFPLHIFPGIRGLAAAWRGPSPTVLVPSYLLSFLSPPLSDRLLRPLPSLRAVLSLSSPLPPVIHPSLIFTDQYAGQQAVWQIVRCAPREEPLSITRVRYWIQSGGFSRVKWKDQAVHSVRWGVSERRALRSQLFPFCDSRLTKIVVLEVFTIWSNCVYQISQWIKAAWSWLRAVVFLAVLGQQ